MALTLDGTLGETLPTWTTAGRPASPTTGLTGYNTTLNIREVWNGSAWTADSLPAAGTSGNVLKSDGTNWTSGAAAGGFSNMQVFTSPGTFTTPATTTQIKVTVVGGGGSGGNCPSSQTSSGGGGGGAAIYVGPVSASTPYAVTVGTGGAGVASQVNGNSGNTSSFTTLASATGGGGGSYTTNPGAITGGAGGAGSPGTLQFTGNAGGSGVTGSAPAILYGVGGSSVLGGGTNGGSVGGKYGGGSGGGSGGTNGAGGAGVVVVEY
jgi:hypothetical protein